jgi:hypothetical protein
MKMISEMKVPSKTKVSIAIDITVHEVFPFSFVLAYRFLTLRKVHPLRHAIDPEVTKRRSTVLSGQSTRSGTSST